MKLYNEFSGVPYEILTPEDTGFTEDMKTFLKKVEEFDRRLASVFDQAFLECNDVESKFKLIWIMGAIALRPVILSQLWPYYERLISDMHFHMDTVKVA